MRRQLQNRLRALEGPKITLETKPFKTLLRVLLLDLQQQQIFIESGKLPSRPQCDAEIP